MSRRPYESIRNVAKLLYVGVRAIRGGMDGYKHKYSSSFVLCKTYKQVG